MYYYTILVPEGANLRPLQLPPITGTTNFSACLAVSDPVCTNLLPKMTDPFQGVFWTSGSSAGFLRWVFGGFDMTCVDVVVRVCCACMHLHTDTAIRPFHLHSDVHPRSPMSILPFHLHACTHARAPAALRRPPPAACRPRSAPAAAAALAAAAAAIFLGSGGSGNACRAGVVGVGYRR